MTAVQAGEGFGRDFVAPPLGAAFAPDFLTATAASPPMDAILPAISAAVVMHIGHMVCLSYVL
jgi:hypothetical protein